MEVEETTSEPIEAETEPFKGNLRSFKILVFFNTFRPGVYECAILFF